MYTVLFGILIVLIGLGYVRYDIRRKTDSDVTSGLWYMTYALCLAASFIGLVIFLMLLFG